MSKIFMKDAMQKYVLFVCLTLAIFASLAFTQTTQAASAHGYAVAVGHASTVHTQFVQPASYSSPFRTGNWTLTSNQTIAYVRSNGRTATAKAIWNFYPQVGWINIWIPPVHATANIGFGIYDTNHRRIDVVSINEQDYSGWTSLYLDAYAQVGSIDVSNNNGTYAGEIGIGVNRSISNGDVNPA